MSSKKDTPVSISVGIAHPFPTFARRVRELLAFSSRDVAFHTTRFATLDEVIDAAANKQIDVVLLSLDLEDRVGLSAFDELHTQTPEVPIITLEKSVAQFGFTAVEQGAQDYLTEDALTTELLEKSIRCAIVHHGRRNEARQHVDLFDNLLENIPEHIYFKDRKSRFIRVNRSMAESFQLKDPKDIIGKTDFHFFTWEHAQPAFDDEQMLISKQLPAIQKTERETFADGRVAWVLTTKMPLRSRNGRIVGTFGISHDITKLQEMEQALEAERNHLKITTAELMKKEMQMASNLALAREIQLALLPRQYPKFPPQATAETSLLHFDHRYIPEQAVGGDFFTIFTVSPTKAGVLICDVMGHGPSAALVTAIVRTLCEDLRQVSHSPSEFLGGLNTGLKRLLQRVEDPMLCTGFYLTVDSETGAVEFCSAGHPSPIHIDRANGRAALLTSYDPSHGPILGLLESARYPTCRFHLESGDAILLFTDGVFEVSCGDGEEYGPQRLLETVSSKVGLETASLMDAVLDDVITNAEVGFEDDVCMVSVERR
ncbi:MAG: SpoIIE family protein phosphatase [Chthoniobacterales bacterium]